MSRTMKTKMMLDAFLAIGNAHAGGPPSHEVTFSDEETAAAAVAFENAGKQS